MVLAGPDGAGKSTLLEALRNGPLAGAPVEAVHSRPGLLPVRTRGPVDAPHAQRPYSVLLSVLKLLYLFVDHRVGALTRLRPAARRGWVVLERGWWDLAVDPARYRMRGTARLARLLGLLQPRPALVVVLETPPQVAVGRKPELTADEVAEQSRRWRSWLPGSLRTLYLDGTAPPADNAARVADLLRRSARGRTTDPGWTCLPSRRSPRWVVPRGPRRVARAALLVHHPVTVRAHLLWLAARAVAGVGGFRLLPRNGAPPEEVRRALDELTAPWDAVAVARTNHDGGWVALLLTREGRPCGLAKLGTSPEARRRLHREGTQLRRFGHRLTPPLRAPAVLEEHPSVLLVEAVRWRPRWRVWRLPPEVAAAVGRLARGPDGVTHGDFAPWNLLRTREGWVLIDWEDATARGGWTDCLHHLVQAHVLLGRPTWRALLRGTSGRGDVGRALDAFAAAARLPRDDAAAELQRLLDDWPVLPPATALGAARHAAASVRRTRLRQRLDRLDRSGERTARRQLLNRVVWGVSDQALSSLTNFAVALWIARTSSAEDFGSFGLGFAVYLVALNVSRALAGDPLSVRYSDTPLRRWRRGTSAAAGTAVAVGCALGVLVSGVGLAVTQLGPRSLGTVLVAIGVCLPGLMLQDLWRQAAFAARKGHHAVLNDAVWALCLLAGLILLTRTGGATVDGYTLAWGLGAAVAAAVGTVQLQLLPRVHQVRRWLRDQRDIAPRFLAELLTESGAAQACMYVVGVLAGLAAVGALRGGQVLLGPLTVLSSGVVLMAVPEAVKALARSRRRMLRLCRGVSVALALPSLAYGAAVLAFPDDAGQALLGASWKHAQPLLLPLVAAAAGVAVTAGAQVGLRALAAARSSLSARIATSAFTVPAVVLGAVLDGAQGAAAALAVAAWFGAAVWWRQLSGELRAGARPQPVPGQPDRSGTALPTPGPVPAAGPPA